MASGWQDYPEDRQLSQALSVIANAPGLGAQVMAALPCRVPEAEKPGNILLLLASLAGAGVIAASIAIMAGNGWNWAESTAGLARVGMCLCVAAVGLGMAWGARWLAELDYAILRRLTGQLARPSAFDVDLVRIGALAIICAGGLAQFMVN